MRGTLMGKRSANDILQPHVGSFLNGLPGAIFQQDNARPHTARVAQDFLCHIQTLPWPACSPDLSPVEHCKVGARVVGCCAHVASVLWYLGYRGYNDTQTKAPSLGYSDTLQGAATGWFSDDSASESQKEI
ncbi:DDE_3 domain-containing protein [Trichonephila clavipes]|uniref:DDE_3 domain-containing protein n=1 Tax=Trichonephila clavipes TaxID=2585209 RepID=A0A8X6VYA6_TRICX|nr:DDE_3 domain-containing protein [Trichonephila clavipes]